MKTKVSLLLLLFAGNLISFAQKTSFKDLFAESRVFLDEENTMEALPILLKMEKEQPKNYNTLATIGYCYLQTKYDKAKAIPYFEKVLADYKNINPGYNPASHKEKSAPVEVIRWAGQAYHFNYQFDHALEKFKEFKDVIDPNNEDMIGKVNRDIFITRNALQMRDDPIEIDLYGLDNLNTEYSEYRPKLNGDETVMYFTSRRPVNENDPKDIDGQYFEDIYVATKTKGVWSMPERMAEPINSASHDACMYISPDEQYMIIYRTDPENNNEGGIYESFNLGSTWSEPALMEGDLNSEYWETDANLSADGKTIVFTSDKPGGTGGRDIYQMNRLPSGEWANVQNIGYPINTEFDEEAAYIHPDGQSIFFSSKGNNTMGGFDIYRCDLMEDGSWGEPTNMNFPINTTGEDVFYFPSNDGLRAYFSSYRKDGKGEQDLYMIELPENQLRTLAVYKGKAMYDNGEIIKNVDIEITNATTNEKYGQYAANQESGKFLFILPPGKTFIAKYQIEDKFINDTIVVPAEGGRFDIVKIITFEGDQLAIRDAENHDGEVIPVVPLADLVEPAKPDSISTLTDEQVEQKLNAGEKLLIDNLYFIYDKDRLINDSKPDLQKVITYMKNNPSMNIILEGHTDSKGEDDYNQRLSERRSARVRAKLIAAGVSSKRIKSIGYGETKPVANNKNPDGTDNPEGRQLNRRVELTVENSK